MISNQVLDHERLGHELPYRTALGQQPNGGLMNVEGWNAVGLEVWMASLYMEIGEVILYICYIILEVYDFLYAWRKSKKNVTFPFFILNLLIFSLDCY